MRTTSLVLAGLLILAGATAVDAQQRPIELGMDGGFVFTSPDIDGVDSTFDISLPFQYFRVGFFMTDHVSLEPVLSFQRLDFGDDVNLTRFSVLGTLLYHFSPDRTRPQFYAQAGGGLEFVDSSEGDSATQWVVGAGAGVKTPVMDHLALRFGLMYLRAFENDDFWAYNAFRGQVGFSFFTR